MKLSRKQLKIAFKVSIALLVITELVIAYQHRIPVQFISQIARDNYQGALVIAVPVIVFMLMALHYLLYTIKGLPILHVIFGTILAIGLFIFSAIMSYFSPQWSDKELLYEGRFNSKEIILQRDSWNYKERPVEVTPIAFGIRYISPTDTTNLPDHKWIKSTKVKNSN